VIRFLPVANSRAVNSVSWYVILGYDRADFALPDVGAESDLDEAHWAYIDKADALLARGPILTNDHDGHAGSIHIIAASDVEAAKSFAINEPYYLAGLYESLEVSAFAPWLAESIWERPGRTASTSWFVRFRFVAHQSGVQSTFIEVPNSVLCAGWMLEPGTGAIVGAALLVNADAAEVAGVVGDVTSQLPIEPLEVTIVPWRRGGRTPSQ
jgi:uncharacterized protein